MRPFSMIRSVAEVLAKACSLPASTPWSTSLPATVCERGMTRPASGSHSAPWIRSCSISGNFFLHLFRADHAGPGAEGLARGDLALEFVHAFVVADARDLEPADARVVAHLLEEIHRVEGGPAGQEVVRRGVAEIRCVGGRADIGRNAGLVDTDDVAPAALDQMMGDGRADDATKADDHDVRLLGKCSHFSLLPVARAGSIRRATALQPGRVGHVHTSDQGLSISATRAAEARHASKKCQARATRNR